MPRKSIETLRNMVGQSHRTIEGFRIEAGKVEEFARAIESSNPIHRESESEGAQDSDPIFAPLIFARASYFPRYRPDELETLHDDEGTYFGFDLGFDRSRTVHGEQEYQYERPLEVGDVVDGETELAAVYQRDGGDGPLTFAEFETTYVDAEDETVLVERATFIETPDADDGEEDRPG